MNTIDQHIRDDFALYNGDCCEVIQTLPSNSLDFTVFSPPFTSLYIYSDSLRDMGNCASDGEFFEHYSFLLGELLRATRPGRLCAVHCKDLVDYKNSAGRAGLRDFPGELIRAHEAAGWKYHSRVTIWKDPVDEMQRTKAHGLLHRQLCNDSSFSRQGLPDYLLVFRKWAMTEEEEALVKPVNGLDNEYRFDVSNEPYIGTEPPEFKDARDYSINVWRKYASPVWFDIDMFDVLNVQQARANEDEKHLCPLQLQVIGRAVQLWSNPGDVVFTPFLGIGSEVVGALRANRRGIGVELKPEYFRVAVRNCEAQIATRAQFSLFESEAPALLEMAL